MKAAPSHRGPNALLAQLGLGLGVLLGGAMLGYATVAYPRLPFLVFGGAAALILAGLAWRRSDIALVALVLLLPFYNMVLAKLYISGVSAGFLTPLRYWKEVVLAAVVLKVFTTSRKEWSNLDKVILLFLGIIVVYVLLPLGGTFYARLLGARQEAAYMLVYVAARHLDLPPRLARRVQWAILAAGAVEAVGALFNHFDPNGWVRFLNSTGWPLYRLFALNAPGGEDVTILSVAGHDFVRAGSFFSSPVNLSYFLLIGIGIVIARMVAGSARRLEIATGVLLTVGLLVALTRSALATVPVMLAMSLILARRRGQMAVLLLVAAAVMLPVAAKLGVGEQISSATVSVQSRNQGHIEALQADVQHLIRYPVGTGLGTSGATAQRFSNEFGVINESAYFQPGTEMGVAGMAVFIIILVLALADLWKRARGGSTLAVAAFCGLLGIALGGLVLHTLDDINIAWSIWLLVGLALAAQPSPEPAPEAAPPRPNLALART